MALSANSGTPRDQRTILLPSLRSDICQRSCHVRCLDCCHGIGQRRPARQMPRPSPGSTCQALSGSASASAYASGRRPVESQSATSPSSGRGVDDDEGVDAVPSSCRCRVGPDSSPLVSVRGGVVVARRQERIHRLRRARRRRFFVSNSALLGGRSRPRGAGLSGASSKACFEGPQPHLRGPREADHEGSSQMRV